MNYNYINDKYTRDYYMRAVIIIALNNRVNKKRERKREIILNWIRAWNGSHFVSFGECARNAQERKEYNNACKMSQFLKNVSNTFS